MRSRRRERSRSPRPGATVSAEEVAEEKKMFWTVRRPATVGPRREIEPTNAMTQTDNVGRDDAVPEWVAHSLPERRADIDAEIEKLQRKIDKLAQESGRMESMARLLWQTGPPLEEAVCDLFSAVGFETDPAQPEASYDMTVNLGAGKRLLIKVMGTEENLTPKSREIRQVLETAQDVAGDDDRIVVAANTHRDRPVADRESLDPVTGEALMILTGLGAVFLTTATLFRLWQLSRDDLEATADQLQQLHAAAAGSFTLKTQP